MKLFVKLHDGSFAHLLWTMQSYWVRCLYIVIIANVLFLAFIIYSTFLKRIQKSAKYMRPKKVFRKEELLHKIVLIWQYKMQLQQNYFCTKKDKKFIFLTKVVISKNCTNCENGYLNFFYKINNISKLRQL